MRRPSDVSHLGPVFATRRALDAGISPKRLRAADLASPFTGVRARADAADVTGVLDDVGRRRTEQERAALSLAAAYAQRMAPHEFFSHETAALLWGCPLPALRDERPHVAVLAPTRLIRVSGAVGHEAQPHLTRVTMHPQTGWRIMTPASAWASLGGLRLDPYDLVAVADSLVRVPRMPGDPAREMPPPLATVDHLDAALFAGRRVGKPALRLARERVRTGASSRPETWLRLSVVDAGLPEPVLDHDVLDARGVLIGCVDLAYPALRIALEYEGEHHLTDPAQWSRDIARYERLAAEGWIVVRVTHDALFRDRRDLIRRIRTAIASRS